MFRKLRSRPGTVLTGLLLAGAGAGGAFWWAAPELGERLAGPEAPQEPAASPSPSPELADATLDRLESFQSGERGGELRLGNAELSSVLLYALPGVIPPGVEQPSVELRGGHVHLAARLAVAALPDLSGLRDIVGLLPDTVRVELRGSVSPFRDEGAALRVDRIEASRIPLPPRLIPEILTALGRVAADGLPPDAVMIPLPHGLRAAFVERDTLVLVANR